MVNFRDPAVIAQGFCEYYDSNFLLPSTESLECLLNLPSDSGAQ
jgi:hypothetical protein